MSTYFPLSECSVTAWMNPIHSFIQLECYDMNENRSNMNATYGFYPYGEDELFKDDELGMTKIGAIFFKSIGSLGIAAGSSYPASISTGSAIFGKNKLVKLAASGWRLWDYERPGQIKNDDHLLNDCIDSSCVYSKLKITEEKAWEIAKKINEFSETNDRYFLFGNNCIDFVRRIMDFTGNPDWKTSWNYTKPAALYEKIIALSWHYFGLTT